MGFEVAGPNAGKGAPAQGTLSDKRSASLDVSRLRLINAGLSQGQSSCTTLDNDLQRCCVHHEKESGTGKSGDG